MLRKFKEYKVAVFSALGFAPADASPPTVPAASLPLPFCCAQCCIVCGICPTHSFLVAIQFYCAMLKRRYITVIWCYMMLYEVISFDVDMHHPHWSWRDTPWSPDGHTIRNLRTAWTECRERFMISRTQTQEIWHIHLAALLFLITRNGQGKGSRRLHISCNTQDKLLLEPGIDITKAFWVGKWFISCQCGLDCRRSQILEAITASAKPVISDELWPELAPGSTCPCWHRNRFLEQQGRQTQQPLQHCW